MNLTMVRKATPLALRKLNPAVMIKTPVMFIVEIGFIITLVIAILNPSTFAFSVSAWLFFTVLFAAYAEAIAEGRGKAQAEQLKNAQTVMTARRIKPDGTTETVPASTLSRGDIVIVSEGELIPGDGDVTKGAASIDESAITGESAPVIRESGGDRSAVTGGTRVLSNTIEVTITSEPGKTFMDKLISLVEGAERKKTPGEIALDIFLAVLTVIFILVVASLAPVAVYSGAPQSPLVLIALLVCLIPTTIGALLSAIGIAGMNRLVGRNVLAMSGRAVEAAGDVTTLLLDKTGTITMGNRQAAEIAPVGNTREEDVACAAQLSSLADETPEGRSIVDFVHHDMGLGEVDPTEYASAEFIPFTAETRMSGIVIGNRVIMKGASSEGVEWVAKLGGSIPDDTASTVDRISQAGGGTALVVATNDRESGEARVLGVIYLKDVLKHGIKKRFDQLRAMGIRTVMITGDNRLTAQAIAAEAGVDDFLAEAKPEDKLELIRREQADGAMVAMSGDGTNDAPALAQADVGVAMNTGTQAAKEAANMVDLDSDPTKLIEIVEIGKQLLMTRGALTTFSIANDAAKYFAIIPAMFMVVFPGLSALNIMGLSSPESAILSAVIFNALIIVALIPLALRGVTYKPMSSHKLLRRNLTIYGLGGLIAPFIGIKLIDLVISTLPGF